MALSLDPVEAVRLQPPVAQHLDHLGILLPVLLEDQLSLVTLVFVLPSPPVLTSLSWGERGGREEGERRERRGSEEGEKRERGGREEGVRRERGGIEVGERRERRGREEG